MLKNCQATGTVVVLCNGDFFLLFLFALVAFP